MFVHLLIYRIPESLAPRIPAVKKSDDQFIHQDANDSLLVCPPLDEEDVFRTGAQHLHMR